MFKNLYGFIFFVFVIMSVCSDEDRPSSVSSTEGISIHVAANSDITSELRVVLDFTIGNSSKEAQIEIGKESPATAITSLYLRSLVASSYTSVSIGTGLSYSTQLNQEQSDSDGDELIH